ncbi:hypothetical protein F4805DRAFT_455228 [Annulohypoxylon moriforme]|nr:hypothetical protein F4805DRAFT_455228 [Annulohypoxylon moriforme]
MDVAPKTRRKQEYTSKYFPPNDIIFSGPRDDAHNMGFLAGFAEAQVKLRVREGVLLIRLWSDAYDALEIKQTSDTYQQYLMLVRKIAGRMIGEQLDPKQARNKPLFPGSFIPVAAKVDSDEGASAQAPAQTPKALAPKPSMVMPSQRSTSLQTPMGNLNLHTTKLSSPGTPVKKENEEPRRDEAESSPACVTAFQERCKRLGLRVSSAKD